MRLKIFALLPELSGVQILNSSDPGHFDPVSTAVKMLVALIIILGVLLIAFRFAKQILQKREGESKEGLIKILANKYIGIKKSISLIEVPGAILVLGISNENISLLTKIEDKCLLDKFNKHEDNGITTSFSDQLHKLSSRFKEKGRELKCSTTK